MKIKLWMVALCVFAVIFGGIGISMLTGDWATEGEKEPAKYSTGDFAGEYNPEDIRGSYTFKDVSDSFGIELSVLFDAFGLPAGTDGTVVKTKDIEAQYGDAEIGNGSVQLFVALYKGLPIALDDTWLTPRAAEIVLAANPNLTQEQREYLATHQVNTGLAAEYPATESGETVQADATEAPAAEAEHSEEDEQAIKGNTTFQQVLDLGLSQEQIEAVIGGAMPAANMTIRDYCSSSGLSFSEIKTALTDALAQEN